ncbi:hypothetical protein KR032_008907 [Drosophila birchii]|nr:hypothetical protein KR032_008907 [Drosophila birchii]
MKFLSNFFVVRNQNLLPELSQSWPLWSFAGRIRNIGLYRAAEAENPTDSETELKPVARWRSALTFIKVLFLLMLWSFMAFILIHMGPENLDSSVVTVPPKGTSLYYLNDPEDAVHITLRGPIDTELQKLEKILENVATIRVRVEWRDSITNQTIQLSDIWNVYLLKDLDGYGKASKLFIAKNTEQSGLKAMVSFESKSDDPISLVVVSDASPILSEYGLFYAGFLLLTFYVLIILELTDHTFAALLMATTGVAIITVIGHRPTLEKIISWIDFETLTLLVGMMIIVGIMSETGLFDWLAILAYRISKGHPWPLVFLLGIITATMSCVLDNVTMLLLMGPIAIRLCEAVKVQTPLVLLVVVMFSNLGGSLTPVGDPPNVIISTNQDVVNAGINFPVFVIHMLPGVVSSLIVSVPLVYLIMRKKMFQLSEEQIAASAYRETMRRRLTAEVAQRATVIRDSYAPKKMSIKPATNYFETLAYLQTHFGIQDVPLLVKSVIALTITVLGFLMHPLPFMCGGTLSWVSILGAFLLIILAKTKNIQSVLVHVEWAALIFLAALFVLVEIVDTLGLIRWMSDKTATVLASVNERHQMMVAIILVLWTTAFLSAIVGNVPVTTMMLKMVLNFAENKKINVSLTPLIWSLTFGACFGANGTIFGSTANIVGVAVARQYGYRISFMQFFRYGLPLTIVTLLLVTAYLLIAHVAFTWHKT